MSLCVLSIVHEINILSRVAYTCHVIHLHAARQPLNNAKNPFFCSVSIKKISRWMHEKPTFLFVDGEESLSFICIRENRYPQPSMMLWILLLWCSALYTKAKIGVNKDAGAAAVAAALRARLKIVGVCIYFL